MKYIYLASILFAALLPNSCLSQDEYFYNAYFSNTGRYIVVVNAKINTKAPDFKFDVYNIKMEKVYSIDEEPMFDATDNFFTTRDTKGRFNFYKSKDMDIDYKDNNHLNYLLKKYTNLLYTDHYSNVAVKFKDNESKLEFCGNTIKCIEYDKIDCSKDNIEQSESKLVSVDGVVSYYFLVCNKINYKQYFVFGVNSRSIKTFRTKEFVEQDRVINTLKKISVIDGKVIITAPNIDGHSSNITRVDKSGIIDSKDITHSAKIGNYSNPYANVFFQNYRHVYPKDSVTVTDVIDNGYVYIRKIGNNFQICSYFKKTNCSLKEYRSGMFGEIKTHTNNDGREIEVIEFGIKNNKINNNILWVHGGPFKAYSLTASSLDMIYIHNQMNISLPLYSGGNSLLSHYGSPDSNFDLRMAAKEVSKLAPSYDLIGADSFGSLILIQAIKDKSINKNLLLYSPQCYPILNDARIVGVDQFQIDLKTSYELNCNFYKSYNNKISIVYHENDSVVGSETTNELSSIKQDNILVIKKPGNSHEINYNEESIETASRLIKFSQSK